jgi:CRP/FNR family transcriptional regulator
MADVSPHALRRIALLADLPDDALARVARAARARSCEAGEIVLFQGDPCEAVHLIAEGRARVYQLSPGGREQMLAQLGPGQAFGTALAFLPGAANRATVQALTPLTLYAIPCADLPRLAQASPELALALLQDLAGHLDRLTRLVEDLSLRTVRGRLARFLLEHARAGGEGTTQRWTQDEIAAHVGTVRDVVGRTLRALAEEDLVRMDRGHIVLLDREGLEAEAQS